jgi:hypothetical protein
MKIMKNEYIYPNGMNQAEVDNMVEEGGVEMAIRAHGLEFSLEELKALCNEQDHNVTDEEATKQDCIDFLIACWDED